MTTVEPIVALLLQKEIECMEALNRTLSFYKPGKFETLIFNFTLIYLLLSRLLFGFSYNNIDNLNTYEFEYLLMHTCYLYRTSCPC